MKKIPMVPEIQQQRDTPQNNFFTFDSSFISPIGDSVWVQMGGGLELQPGYYKVNGALLWSRTTGTSDVLDFRGLWTAEDGDNTGTVPNDIFSNANINVEGAQDSSAAIAHRTLFAVSQPMSQLVVSTTTLYMQVLNTTTIYLPTLANIDPAATWSTRCIINAERLRG